MKQLLISNWLFLTVSLSVYVEQFLLTHKKNRITHMTFLICLIIGLQKIKCVAGPAPTQAELSGPCMITTFFLILTKSRS